MVIGSIPPALTDPNELGGMNAVQAIRNASVSRRAFYLLACNLSELQFFGHSLRRPYRVKNNSSPAGQVGWPESSRRWRFCSISC